MAKWLNCCGEADHLLFCNHYSALLNSTLNVQYSIDIVWLARRLPVPDKQKVLTYTPAAFPLGKNIWFGYLYGKSIRG
jgi:hypothetical protein